MNNSTHREPSKGPINQYQESLKQLQVLFNDCLRFGYGDLTVSMKMTSNSKCEVHIKYGRDYKFLIPSGEITALISGSRRGSAN